MERLGEFDMTTEEMIAEYLAKGGKIAKCPTVVAKGANDVWKYGKGSVAYRGRKVENLRDSGCYAKSN